MVQGGRSESGQRILWKAGVGKKIVSVAIKQGLNKVGGIQHYIREVGEAPKCQNKERLLFKVYIW